MKYLGGHIPRAVNLSVSKVFDQNTLALLPDDQLAEMFGKTGIDEHTAILVYDGYDGQSGAMLAWILEYLGHSNVAILSHRIEGWSCLGHELLYKPVTLPSRTFHAKPLRSVRVLVDELLQKEKGKMFDLRGKDEFYGMVASEVRSGHIPRAVSLPWTELIGDNHQFLKLATELESIAKKYGLSKDDNVITYCSYGPRAAVGYIALSSIGYNVRVYDGSFHQWAQRSELPVEGEGLQLQI